MIIPTYRRAPLLSRALESVLNQTYPNTEIMVVDDNAPDSADRKETQKVMESYSHYQNIHYLLHPENRNGAAARNTGIQNSRGLYLCFLDDDDWYLPDKLIKEYQYLEEHPAFDAVYCGYERNRKVIRPFREGDLSFELLSGIELIYTNTIMMRREMAVRCGGWDERFRRNQEAVFLLRFFACHGKIGAIPDILVKFDVSDDRNRSDPVQFEKDFEMFLRLHENAIQKCTSRYPDARERIFSYRYRGVLINYIKYGYWTRAVSLYREMSSRCPGRFRRDCLTYIKRKIMRENLFQEYQ